MGGRMAPRPTVGQMRRASERENYQMRRMMSEQRRTRTIARAMIPRLKRHFRHTDEPTVLGPLDHGPAASKSNSSSRFMRPDPEVHASAEMEKRKGPALAAFQESFSGFQMQFYAALEAAVKADRDARADAEELRVEIARASAERAAMGAEDRPGPPDDTLPDAAASDEAAAPAGDEATAEEEHQQQQQEDTAGNKRARETKNVLSSSMAAAKPNPRRKRARNGTSLAFRGECSRPFGPLTQHFQCVPRVAERAVRAWYTDFYHDTLVVAPEAVVVRTPQLRETPVFASVEAAARKRAARLRRWATFTMPVAERLESAAQRGPGRLGSEEGVCPACDTNTLALDSTTAETVCVTCGSVFESSSRLRKTYAEFQSSTVHTTQPYERISHFKEFMTRTEGMERTEIPEAVTHRLLLELHKRCVNPVREPQLVTYTLLRGFLQAAGYSHFNENIVKIRAILVQRQSVTFTDAQREELMRRFEEIQAPFERHKGVRKNFLSYSYVMNKLCQLLGYTYFLQFLPLLKAQQNLLSADRIWRKICEECRYEFIPTDPSDEAYPSPSK